MVEYLQVLELVKPKSKSHIHIFLKEISQKPIAKLLLKRMYLRGIYVV